MKNDGGTNDGGRVSRSMPKSNKKVEKILAVCWKEGMRGAMKMVCRKWGLEDSKLFSYEWFSKLELGPYHSHGEGRDGKLEAKTRSRKKINRELQEIGFKKNEH